METEEMLQAAIWKAHRLLTPSKQAYLVLSPASPSFTLPLAFLCVYSMLALGGLGSLVWWLRKTRRDRLSETCICPICTGHKYKYDKVMAELIKTQPERDGRRAFLPFHFWLAIYEIARGTPNDEDMRQTWKDFMDDNPLDRLNCSDETSPNRMDMSV